MGARWRVSISSFKFCMAINFYHYNRKETVSGQYKSKRNISLQMFETLLTLLQLYERAINCDFLGPVMLNNWSQTKSILCKLANGVATWRLLSIYFIWYKARSIGHKIVMLSTKLYIYINYLSWYNMIWNCYNSIIIFL